MLKDEVRSIWGGESEDKMSVRLGGCVSTLKLGVLEPLGSSCTTDREKKGKSSALATCGRGGKGIEGG